jgi:hypothetical protein
MEFVIASTSLPPLGSELGSELVGLCITSHNRKSGIASVVI